MAKLTDWEAGQEMIKAFDAVCEARAELHDAGYEKLSALLTEVANKIAEAFNKMDSHEFGLPVETDWRAEACENIQKALKNGSKL